MTYELEHEVVQLIRTLVRLGMISGFGQTGYLRVEEDGTFLIEVYFD